MPETGDGARRRRRADAVRSITAILDAAVDVLGAQPEASLDEIAKAAGVTRQTIYAHFGSREALIRAVVERALAETVAAIDGAEPHRGPPADALDRFIAASWQTLERYPLLMDIRLPMRADEEHEFHRPILERLERLVRRGQRAGVFDRALPRPWLLAAFLGLAHTAAEEVRAGRISGDGARQALTRTIRRTFGVEP